LRGGVAVTKEFGPQVPDQKGERKKILTPIVTGHEPGGGFKVDRGESPCETGFTGKKILRDTVSKKMLIASFDEE